LISKFEGQIVLEVTGEGAFDLFKNEIGGHRWQRIPPTEQNGRRHSSTFTVAVFCEESSKPVTFDESKVEYEALIGHGPGGQHRQKNATAIRAVYTPTGETVFIQNERSQHANKTIALNVLRERVIKKLSGLSHNKVNSNRKDQIGSGERSDKIRTVQEQNDKVVNHLNNKKCNLNSYFKGEIWRLH
jgi:peptide chain release factor 1